MNFPVLDLHCDTALSLLREEGGVRRSLRRNTGHIDLARGSKIGGYAQCFACFTHPFDTRPHPMGWTPEMMFEKELAVLREQFSACSDLLRPARNAEELRRNREEGFVSGVLTIEGTAGIGYDAGRLEELRREGFCVVSLTWNEKNPLAGSHVTGGGLTERGREFVKEAQRVGMIVDVSHISDEAFWDIMDVTEGPIVATHSNSRSVFPVSRNLTDDMFRAICSTGGVAGFNQYASFVGEPATLDAACRHILRFLELDPDGKHIALGGDLDGCDVLPEGFEGVQHYPRFAQALLDRGAGETTVADIFWNNAFGVMEQCSM